MSFVRLPGWLLITLSFSLSAFALPCSAAEYQLVLSFAGGDGFKSQSALVVGHDGLLHGTAFGGGSIGSGDGTAFRLSADGRLSLLHSFDGQRGGEGPAGLTAARDGSYYGVTTRGGRYLQGTVWRMSPQGRLSVLHAFHQDGQDGSTPQARLLETRDGQFYGTTSYGGRQGWGSVFRIDAAGTLTLLHSFDHDGRDGVGPGLAGLMQTRDGAIHGTTRGGGQHDHGTVFRLSVDGALTVLHAFRGADGRGPASALTEGPDGALYGSTSFGGAYDRGTVYRLDRRGALTVLHHFSGKRGDGAEPAGDLLLASDGHLYGVTERGGRFDGGVAYRLGTNGSFTRLQSFDPAGADGYSPRAGLVEAPDGALYGTTYQGGAHDAGGIYRIRLR